MTEINMLIAAIVGCIVMYYSVFPMLKSLLSGFTKLFKWGKAIVPRIVAWLHDHMPENRIGRFFVKAIIAVILFPVTPTVAAVHTAIENPEKAPGIAAIYLVGALIFAVIWLKRRKSHNIK